MKKNKIGFLLLVFLSGSASFSLRGQEENYYIKKYNKIEKQLNNECNKEYAQQSIFTQFILRARMSIIKTQGFFAYDKSFLNMLQEKQLQRTSEIHLKIGNACCANETSQQRNKRDKMSRDHLDVAMRTCINEQNRGKLFPTRE